MIRNIFFGLIVVSCFVMAPDSPAQNVVVDKVVTQEERYQNGWQNGWLQAYHSLGKFPPHITIYNDAPKFLEQKLGDPRTLGEIGYQHGLLAAFTYMSK